MAEFVHKIDKFGRNRPFYQKYELFQPRNVISRSNKKSKHFKPEKKLAKNGK